MRPREVSNGVDARLSVRGVINAIKRSPWWRSPAIVISYDDSDGWYDHQMGPIANGSAVLNPIDTKSSDQLNGAGRCGNTTPVTDDSENPIPGRCGLESSLTAGKTGRRRWYGCRSISHSGYGAVSRLSTHQWRWVRVATEQRGARSSEARRRCSLQERKYQSRKRIRSLDCMTPRVGLKLRRKPLTMERVSRCIPSYPTPYP